MILILKNLKYIVIAWLKKFNAKLSFIFDYFTVKKGLSRINL